MGAQLHSLPIRDKSAAACATGNSALSRRIRRLFLRPGFRRLRRTAALTVPCALCLMAALPIPAEKALADDLRRFPILHLTGSNLSPDADLVLLCDDDGPARPRFQNQRTGAVFPITDPHLRAIAEKTCSQGLLGTQETSTVKIVNNRAEPIFVGYDGPITWGKDCAKSANGVEIGKQGSCTATVVANNQSTRFCAAAGRVPNCAQAQANHLTMIETTPQTSAECAWLGRSGTCIWYDISLIPSWCTDADWQKDRCKGEGGASYNYPVELTCPAETTYTCRGPTSTKYGSELYPQNCGNPDPPPPHCVGNGPQCVNAYFYPMYDKPESSYAPNSVCPGEQILTITFLSGP
jgi:hypothetical protein